METVVRRERVVALDGEVTDGFDVRRAYAAHGSAIFGFVLNGVGDRQLAEDCVQEIFLRAWRARSRYRTDLGSERTWLFAIARNVVVDALRARARRPVPVGEDRVESAAGSTEVAGAVEDRVDLLRALALVSAEHREVIVAVQLEGLDYRQLADRTGVAVPTLRTRMFYGLRALREILGEEDDHDA